MLDWNEVPEHLQMELTSAVIRQLALRLTSLAEALGNETEIIDQSKREEGRLDSLCTRPLRGCCRSILLPPTNAVATVLTPV